MSSKNGGENPPRRKSKVSWGRRIRPGLVDPKARPKGVVDGKAGYYSCTACQLFASDALQISERAMVCPFRKKKVKPSGGADFGKRSA